MATIAGLQQKIEQVEADRAAVEAELAELEDKHRLYRQEFGPYIELAGALAERAQDIARGDKYAVTIDGAPPSRADKRSAKTHQAENDRLKAAVKAKRAERQKLQDQAVSLAGQLEALDNERLLARAPTVEREIADLQAEQSALRKAVNTSTADLAEQEGQIDGLFAAAERKGNGAAKKAAEDAELKIYTLQMTIRRKKAALSSVEADLAQALADQRRIDEIEADRQQAEALAAYDKKLSEVIALLDGDNIAPDPLWVEFQKQYNAAFSKLPAEQAAQLGHVPQPIELFLEYAQRQYQAMGGRPDRWVAYGWMAGTSRAVRPAVRSIG